MRTLFLIALIFINQTALAKTEAQCLKEASDKMPKKYRGMEFAKYIMICNVKLMEGFTIYLSGGKYIDKRIREMYPCKDSDGNECVVTALEKAERLLEYNECEKITYALSDYMSRCTKR